MPTNRLAHLCLRCNSAIVFAALFFFSRMAWSQFLTIYPGPAYTPGTPTYQLSSPGFPIGLSDSGTTAASYKRLDAGGNSQGLPPVRWGPTLSSEALSSLNTNFDSPFGQSIITSIDNQGDIFGYSTFWNQSPTPPESLGDRPVRWNYGSTTPIELGNLGLDSNGVSNGRPLAVNSGGVIVGWDSKPTFNGTLAVKWNSSGVPTELGTLGINAGDKLYYQAVGINTAGTIVGNVQASDSQGINAGVHGIRWDAGGTVATDLGASMFPKLINSAGMIAGDNGGTGSRAVRWDPGATQATSLLGLSGQISTTGISGMNDSGVIVGHDMLNAVRWDPNSDVATELNLLAGASSMGASAINNEGIIVGNATTSQGKHAVFWGTDSVPVDLNTLIDPGSGWVLNSATLINDNGWIAGVGTFDPDGPGGQAAYSRLFVLQLPEPGTLMLSAIGFILLLRKSRCS